MVPISLSYTTLPPPEHRCGGQRAHEEGAERARGGGRANRGDLRRVQAAGAPDKRVPIDSQQHHQHLRGSRDPRRPFAPHQVCGNVLGTLGSERVCGRRTWRRRRERRRRAWWWRRRRRRRRCKTTHPSAPLSVAAAGWRVCTGALHRNEATPGLFGTNAEAAAAEVGVGALQTHPAKSTLVSANNNRIDGSDRRAQ